MGEVDRIYYHPWKIKYDPRVQKYTISCNTCESESNSSQCLPINVADCLWLEKKFVQGFCLAEDVCKA